MKSPANVNGPSAILVLVSAGEALRALDNKQSEQFSSLDYIDDYATCAATYAALRIFTGRMEPELVTTALHVNPTKSRWEGEGGARLNGWFLSSKGRIDSRDVRRHVDWLLEMVGNKRRELLSLQSQVGVWMDVFCYWRSTQGHGGPCLVRSKCGYSLI